MVKDLKENFELFTLISVTILLKNPQKLKFLLILFLIH
jgi:hypothetical protein